MTEKQLHPLVADLAQDFAIVDEARLEMPGDRLARWKQRLTVDRLGDERIEVTAHLLVLAVRFAREAPDETEEAVRQMAELIAPLLPAGGGQDEFAGEGSAGSAAAALRLIGGSAGRRNSNATAGEGGISPLDLLLGRGG